MSLSLLSIFDTIVIFTFFLLFLYLALSQLNVNCHVTVSVHLSSQRYYDSRMEEQFKETIQPLFRLTY